MAKTTQVRIANAQLSKLSKITPDHLKGRRMLARRMAWALEELFRLLEKSS